MKNNRYVQYNHKIGLGSLITVEGIEKVLGYEELIEEVSKNCKGNKKMISEMNQIITEEEQRITELVNVITKALKEFRTEMEEKIKKEEDGKC